MSTEKKRCENCNKFFGPRLMRNGKPEYPSFFKKKRHCSQLCGVIAAQARRKLIAARAEA